MKAFLARITPYDSLRNWLRGLAVTALAGGFLTLAGAFGTGELPLVQRITYWMVLMVLGYLWGAFVARFFFRGGRLRTGIAWLDAAAATLVMSTPFTVVVWYTSATMFGGVAHVANLPYMFLPVVAVSGAIITINILLETRRAAMTEAGPQPAKFLERLPLKLRGGDVWAVEAEDHYLRLHTSKGQDLILMRLADAVAELDGIEGAQVHRSWWVAREAITDAKRGDGRATLTLRDGAEVPVSRTYAGMLRERGWI
jgi:DNA-binding LytR/AlgR family response regulator